MSPWKEYKTGMDKTQLDALKTILSHNLSIVQGNITVSVEKKDDLLIDQFFKVFLVLVRHTLVPMQCVYF